ncbi:MAG: hypothetical protein NTW62_01550 [Candidatus Nomurabacteria bacterium]|nr:hypothetical protein [Candidatus Nomurabacteria bacterium]
MKIIKIFIVSGERNHETVVNDLLDTWLAKYPNIPGFSKENVEMVKISNYNSSSSIIKDTLTHISMYNHLDKKQILVVYEGNNTAKLCNHLTTHTVDLSLLTAGLIKTFKGFKNLNRKELFPWILSGEIMRCVEKVK